MTTETTTAAHVSNALASAYKLVGNCPHVALLECMVLLEHWIAAPSTITEAQLLAARAAVWRASDDLDGKDYRDARSACLRIGHCATLAVDAMHG